MSKTEYINFSDFSNIFFLSPIFLVKKIGEMVKKNWKGVICLFWNEKFWNSWENSFFSEVIILKFVASQIRFIYIYINGYVNGLYIYG